MSVLQRLLLYSCISSISSVGYNLHSHTENTEKNTTFQNWISTSISGLNDLLLFVQKIHLL